MTVPSALRFTDVIALKVKIALPYMLFRIM